MEGETTARNVGHSTHLTEPQGTLKKMAPQRRTGDYSYIFLGRQLKYGVPIIGEKVFDGEAPSDSVAKLIRNHFVFTRNTLDPTSEETESESIIGAGARPDSIITKRGGGGEWEFELLPDDAIHLLLGWFNPDTLPTNEKLKDHAIPASAVTVNSNTVTVDNTADDTAAKWPGQLKMKLTGASGAGKIRIYGQKRGSRSNQFNSPTTEEITVGNSDTEVLSTKFYHRANKLDLIWGDGTAPNAVALSFVPDTNMAQLALNTKGNPFDGWSAAMIKAFTPYIAYNIIPNLFRLSIGANIRLLIGLFASYVQEARSLADPSIKVNSLENLRTPETGILAKYPRGSLEFYPSLGTAVVLGNPDESLEDLVKRIDDKDNAPEPTAVTSVDIEGNHNYVDPEGFTGDPLAGQPVTDETQTRTVTVNASIYHETDDATEDNKTIHWQDLYFEKRKVPIVIRNYNWLANGRQVLIESRFARCGLTEVPGLPIEGRGSVTRNLAFEAKPSPNSTTPDEVSMLFYSKDGFKE